VSIETNVDISNTTDETAPLTRTGDDDGRRRDFNRLWVGQSISAFGSQVTMLALPLTAVLYLHATATQIGLLGAARELPVLGLMLFFGVVVDRMRRRPLMIGADLGRAGAIGAVPIFAWLGFLSMSVLYLVALVVGCLAVVFSLAYQAYLPTLVGPDRLLSGNSRLQTTQSLSDVAGPGLAGLLVQLVKAPFALLADVLSFLALAWSVAAIRTPNRPWSANPPPTTAVLSGGCSPASGSAALSRSRCWTVRSAASGPGASCLAGTSSARPPSSRCRLSAARRRRGRSSLPRSSSSPGVPSWRRTSSR
jgi:Transmembrane secretion effector